MCLYFQKPYYFKGQDMSISGWIRIPCSFLCFLFFHDILVFSTVFVYNDQTGLIFNARLGDNDLDSCGSPCDEKKKSSNAAVPVAASLGALAFVLIVASAIFCILKKKRKALGI